MLIFKSIIIYIAKKYANNLWYNYPNQVLKNNEVKYGSQNKRLQS